LELVGLSKTREILTNRVDQLSGGMRQRVMIAMAISCQPVLLIADEPTTALDVTLQRQITELLAKLREQMGLALLLITHDLGVVAETCDSAAVMYGGELVERGTTEDVLVNPLHDYTKALLTSIPRLGDTRKRLPTVASTAPWLTDTRQQPIDVRPRTSWDEVSRGRWLRQILPGTPS
jgi:ABC-type dipeptide/oligopeptide/nickel transport system ATPase component